MIMEGMKLLLINSSIKIRFVNTFIYNITIIKHLLKHLLKLKQLIEDEMVICKKNLNDIQNESIKVQQSNPTLSEDIITKQVQ